MNVSTNILDLPVDPVVSINGSGITLTAAENVGNQELGPGPGSGSGVSLDQTTINQIVSSLQQASQNGYTQLPSRDIQMTTTGHSHDPQVQPNYVPPPPPDYIQHTEKTEDIIQSYNKQVKTANSLDDVYNELQTPLLLAVLYLLFQIPFFQNFLFVYLPIFFKSDGNMNFNGLIFKSVLFGLVFYVFNKITTYFAPF